MANDFVPRRWLANGHMQTIAGNFQQRRINLPTPEERLFRVEADVQLLCRCHWQAQRKQRLTLLIVHGLEGSSQSGYVLGTAARAWARGWNIVRMNVRGCGGTEQLSATLYHSGLSQDVEKLVQELISTEGLERIALVGFSMGGNQVLRAMGRLGDSAPAQLVAAATVSPACDLGISSDRIHRPSNFVYEQWFMASLRKSFRRKASLWKGRYDPSRLKGVYSVRTFDDRITSRYMGFQNADDYYDKSSSMHVLDKIARPTLVIHAADDPFVAISAESRRKLEENPQIAFLPTAHGGHCAFLARPMNGDGDGRWAEAKIIEFLGKVEERR
ncbi:MAG: alpha/beta fold hydrolase [Acidobacteriota bacterium]|nr:alpha/beta fold hydrolase [Acidobacteriota bacterium]